MELAQQAAAGGDSGVETECDLESNDSSMSVLSVGQAEPPVPLPPVSPRPPPPSEPQSPTIPPPHPHPSEDGYLADCSSDGGNEKNFPLPPDWQHHPSRISLPPSPPSCPLNPLMTSSPPQEEVEPPAGLSMSSLMPMPSELSGPLGLGYQVRETPGGQSSLRTKMRAVGFRSKHNRAVKDDWDKIRAAMAERKMRIAANTNNTEQLERLLNQSGSMLDVKSVDEHKRSALHFASSKGYSEVVEILLRHGADPNQKDQLGNTALHLAACTNHVPVVTLLLRAGTDLSTLDNHGRTPLQLAQSKLKILQRNSEQGLGMKQVKAEVESVLEMMREYLRRETLGNSEEYDKLLTTFSQRLSLHTTHSSLSSDLGNLLESLGGLTISGKTQV